MFSGIVERQGKLIKRSQQGKQMTLTFQAKGWDKPLKRGESISINGVCLTVLGHPKGSTFAANVVRETLQQTTLGKIKLRDSVNLERSVKWGERMGGHFVLGHVDGIGRIAKRKTQGKNITLTVEAPSSILQHLVPKGSVAIEGVSLTLQKLSNRSFTIAVIPHTAKSTVLGKRKVGELVNLEADVIAKHLARLVQSPNRSYATHLQ